jgi:hypothetical protein
MTTIPQEQDEPRFREVLRKQFAAFPVCLFLAACLLPVSFAMFGKDFGGFCILPALWYAVALFAVCVSAIVITRGRRALIWIAAAMTAVLPYLAFVSGSPHGP